MRPKSTVITKIVKAHIAIQQAEMLDKAISAGVVPTVSEAIRHALDAYLEGLIKAKKISK